MNAGGGNVGVAAVQLVGLAVLATAGTDHTRLIVRSFGLFVAGLVLLFVLSGLGNGPTYKLIPAIFHARAAVAMRAGTDGATAAADARRLSRAVIGLAGAVGAFGGVFVNLVLRESFLARHTGDAAYAACIAFYAVCLVVTWAVYLCPGRERQSL